MDFTFGSSLGRIFCLLCICDIVSQAKTTEQSLKVLGCLVADDTSLQTGSPLCGGQLELFISAAASTFSP